MVSHGSLFCSNIGPIKDDLRQFTSIYVNPFSICVNLRSIYVNLSSIYVNLRSIYVNLRQFTLIYVQIW